MTSDSIPPQGSQESAAGNQKVNLNFKAVVRAFIANVLIALIKLISWFFTGSSAMFSEAVHSGVDSFNSICLMVGLKRGSRPADGVHPFGHGLETNVWTIVACILMFFGAAVSLISAYNKIFSNNQDIMNLLNNYGMLAIILIASICSETWAVNSAVHAVLDESNVKHTNPIVDFIKSIKYVHKINTPTTKYV